MDALIESEREKRLFQIVYTNMMLYRINLHLLANHPNDNDATSNKAIGYSSLRPCAQPYATLYNEK